MQTINSINSEKSFEKIEKENNMLTVDVIQEFKKEYEISHSKKKTMGFYGGKFITPHMGHVACILKASTMVDELHVLIITDENYERESLYKDGIMEPVSIAKRLRWLKHITKDMPHVKVGYVSQEVLEDDLNKEWDDGSDGVKALIGEDIDKVFFSEDQTYVPHFERNYPESEIICLFPDRTEFPISSTEIRRDGVLAHWDMIPPEVRKDFVKKIVIVGTESNGKSTLVKNLARYFQTTRVDELGRTLYDEIGSYETLPEDFAKIAIIHAAEVEKAKSSARKILFVDTEAWVTQNFSIDYENKVDPVVQAIAENQKYDLYLFLEPDVEWIDDGSRIFGTDDVRKKASERLKNFLKDQNVNMVEISGDYEERFNKSIEAVKNLI